MATRQQIKAAAAILQPKLATNPEPSLAVIMDCAHAAGIDMVGRWHLDRILSEARILDCAALLAGN